MRKWLSTLSFVVEQFIFENVHFYFFEKLKKQFEEKDK